MVCRGRTGPKRSRGRPLAAQKMKTEDVARHDWPALVTRLAPRFGSRRPHAIAAVVVRSK